MLTLPMQIGPTPEGRSGSVTLAFILVSFLWAAPGQAQAKPACPCWEDSWGQPGLMAVIAAFS